MSWGTISGYMDEKSYTLVEELDGRMKVIFPLDVFGTGRALAFDTWIYPHLATAVLDIIIIVVILVLLFMFWLGHFQMLRSWKSSRGR